MSLFTTTRLYNVPAGREAEYACWFEEKNAQDLAHMSGFKCADRFELTPKQIMPDIAQPYRFMSVYDLDFCHTGD
jgi:hypothetical protein